VEPGILAVCPSPPTTNDATQEHFIANDVNSYDYEFPTRKLDAELRRLKEMNLPFSADFAINASQVTASSDKSVDVEPGQVATAAGAFLAGRGALADARQIETLADELRRTLTEAATSDEAKAHLLEIWTLTEPHLHQREADELGPTVFATLFGDPKTPASLSRGGHAQGGGGG
jgi:hypothetical protein